MLKELVQNDFLAVVCSVAAAPLDENWLGRRIDEQFIIDMEKMQDTHKINPAGEGGEYESFVLNCPMFSKALKITDRKDSGRGNCWRMEIDVE